EPALEQREQVRSRRAGHAGRAGHIVAELPLSQAVVVAELLLLAQAQRVFRGPAPAPQPVLAGRPHAARLLASEPRQVGLQAANDAHTWARVTCHGLAEVHISRRRKPRARGADCGVTERA